MTGVAALPAMSLPDIAMAMPKTGDSAAGTQSIFDDLLAALAPTVTDQTGAPAQAPPQATPPAPAGASDTVIPQAIASDAVASFEAVLGDAANILSLLPPSQPQSEPAKPATALPNPIITDFTGLPPAQNGNAAPLQPRPGRSERPGATAPTSTATSDGSLVALAMILPQLPPASDVPAAPVNSSLEDVTIGSSDKTSPPNPLPGMETNVAPQKDVANAAAQNLPADSTPQPQPANTDSKAIPAQGSMALVLPQAGNAVAAFSLKGAPSPAAGKSAANSVARPAQTSTMAGASKATASMASAQTDNAAPPLPNSDVPATADAAPSNPSGRSETAAHSSQAFTAVSVPRPDDVASTVASNGYATQTPANNAPIALGGITAVNAMWADAPQTGDVAMNLVLSAAGVVPDQASVDALALRIAAKSADGESQFQIRLDPPSLGRIEIHLNMDSQGNAQAQLSADRPQTLDALQRDSGALERALKDAGLDLPGGLSFSLKGDGKSAAWRDSQNSSRSRAMQIDALDAANGGAPILGLTSTGQGWGAASLRLDISV